MIDKIVKEKENILLELYKQYCAKKDEIHAKYGKTDGFIISGIEWPQYYKGKIDSIIEKIRANKLTESDAMAFYKKFGFSPKIYVNSFIKEGVDKIGKLFLFLADSKIEADEKIMKVVEDIDSPLSIKGVGINFITLFLTVNFPAKYAQWNRQIDEALNRLGLYPQRLRGEKNSTLYLKINNILLSIAELIGVKNLTILDNILYCYNKGYVETKKPMVPKEIKEKIKVIESDTLQEEKQTEKAHLEMQYYLVKIGNKKGYDVCVAQNDKNKEYNNEKLALFCLKEMPAFTQPITLEIAKYIDVIWFKKRTTNPVRFFEIEHTSSVFSGLLRLNDVMIDFPIQKATIIIPKARESLVKTQIERRTFKASTLSDFCDYKTYDEIRKWFEAAKIYEGFD